MFNKISVLIVLLASFTANAGIVIIGSPDLTGPISAKEVKKVYLGKKVNFNGGKLTAIEINESEAIKSDFHKQVTNKSIVQLNSFWAKQLFTGKAKPLKTTASQAEMKAKVATGSAMIGYVDESLVDDQVVVLLKL
ncbi:MULTISPECIES: phosphate ABC transporter substrate-binding protein [Aliivibrio]|nr:phosphate ABC transporter substrate-binding protein [Aliivibrio sifiae]